MQLKAQLLSSHQPHKFAQAAQIQVTSLTGRFQITVQPMLLLTLQSWF